MQTGELSEAKADLYVLVHRLKKLKDFGTDAEILSLKTEYLRLLAMLKA